MWRRLQPYVMRLQPYVTEAATVRGRRGMLVDVSTVVTGAACNILDVMSETRANAGGGEAAFQYTVQLEDKARLEEMHPKPDPNPSPDPEP